MNYFTVRYDSQNRVFKLIHGKLSTHHDGEELPDAEISVEEAEKAENSSSVRDFLARWPVVLSNN